MMSQAVASFSLRYRCNWAFILTCAQLHDTSLKAAGVFNCNTIQCNAMNYNTIQPLCSSHNCYKEDMVAGVQKS